MDPIETRYGEGVTLPLDTGDITDVSADIYVGKPGEVYKITKHIDLIAGKGTFVFLPEDTRIPLDTYYYQINVLGDGGPDDIQKFPSPEGEEPNFPEFIIAEALDETEVV